MNKNNSAKFSRRSFLETYNRNGPQTPPRPQMQFFPGFPGFSLGNPFFQPISGGLWLLVAGLQRHLPGCQRPVPSPGRQRLVPLPFPFMAISGRNKKGFPIRNLRQFEQNRICGLGMLFLLYILRKDKPESSVELFCFILD